MSEKCLCSLCCYGFPCAESTEGGYTWETACAEAFAPGQVEQALAAEGLQPEGVISIRLGCTTESTLDAC